MSYVYGTNMSINDNSVNIESETSVSAGENRESYHHGDLHGTLIREGLAVLDSGARAEDISLRALARTAGVSATAVYRHFPDKAALMKALAWAGLDRMAELQIGAMAEARNSGATAREAFRASGAAYVRFALDNPELFRLMWRKAPETDNLVACIEDTHPAMQYLRHGIDSVLPNDADDVTRRTNALRAWAVVHGLAMLALDKQITLDAATIDAVLDTLSFG